MHHRHQSERTSSRLKPRFPRLMFSQRRAAEAQRLACEEEEDSLFLLCPRQP